MKIGDVMRCGVFLQFVVLYIVVFVLLAVGLVKEDINVNNVLALLGLLALLHIADALYCIGGRR